MLETVGTFVLIKKKGQMSMYDESQFDSQLSQLLQLVSAWPVELRDRYEHNYLKNIMKSYYDHKIYYHNP